MQVYNPQIKDGPYLRRYMRLISRCVHFVAIHWHGRNFLTLLDFDIRQTFLELPHVILTI